MQYFSQANPINEYVEVKESPVEGMGVFAKKFIPKGTKWWHATKNDVLLLSRAQWEVLNQSYHTKLIDEFIQSIITYSYYSANLDCLILDLDNSRHVNHSDNPNCGGSDESPLESIALRDIYPNEEIFEDYHEMECPWTNLYPGVERKNE